MGKFYDKLPAELQKKVDAIQATIDAAPTISASDLSDAVKASPASALQLHLSDSQYTVVDQTTWAQVMQVFAKVYLPYTPEKRDCDDYAFAFRGNVPMAFELNSVGIVIDYTGQHAYNIVVTKEDDGLHVKLVEPQSDSFVLSNSESGADSAPYALQYGTIWF